MQTSQCLVVSDFLVSCAVDRHDVSSGEEGLHEEVRVLAAQMVAKSGTEELISMHPKLHAVHDDHAFAPDLLKDVHHDIVVCNWCGARWTKGHREWTRERVLGLIQSVIRRRDDRV